MQQSSATVVQRDLLIYESYYKNFISRFSLNLQNKEWQRELRVSKAHSNSLCSIRDASVIISVIQKNIIRAFILAGAVCNESYSRFGQQKKKITANDIMTALSEEIQAEFRKCRFSSMTDEDHPSAVLEHAHAAAPWAAWTHRGLLCRRHRHV